MCICAGVVKAEVVNWKTLLKWISMKAYTLPTVSNVCLFMCHPYQLLFVLTHASHTHPVTWLSRACSVVWYTVATDHVLLSCVITCYFFINYSEWPANRPKTCLGTMWITKHTVYYPNILLECYRTYEALQNNFVLTNLVPFPMNCHIYWNTFSTILYYSLLFFSKKTHFEENFPKIFMKLYELFFLDYEYFMTMFK